MKVSTILFAFLAGPFAMRAAAITSGNPPPLQNCPSASKFSCGKCTNDGDCFVASSRNGKCPAQAYLACRKDSTGNKVCANRYLCPQNHGCCALPDGDQSCKNGGAYCDRPRAELPYCGKSRRDLRRHSCKKDRDCAVKQNPGCPVLKPEMQMKCKKVVVNKAGAFQYRCVPPAPVVG
ncbi:hypothetical protein H634G_06632 [Metarhizium anisopliae BRIP 53293]|uniref:Dickkopf N-terminal cysteine-rich domain-containing protein n=1 Tax=Metarhizium anisopliae BRIP 53293 TaxID=1291518 RepID=A0A0D9NVN5_METAN|nr:hypothetical protein H634G_06632 [Metarhizium anisopliae BRIP 53293]KJK87063.1 hypothetical protein H633G_09087 [Metarhizium anisopliae BRIP 53284]